MTPYHCQYWANALVLKDATGSIESVTRSIASARVDLNPHQVDASLFALRSPLSKGAVFADEVGLGKTIEAGIVIAQRWAERRRRVLLIVPAILRKQWQQELDDKFYLPSVILEFRLYKRLQHNGSPLPFEQSNRIVICSYHFAAAKEQEIRSIRWDVVVIDEAYEAIISKGFRTLTPNTFSMNEGEGVRDFRTPVEDRLMIRGMVFGGFRRCLYPQQKFDTDSERRFSVILESDRSVLKWLKPARCFFEIHYRHEGRDASYEPDFVVETENALYLCEPKRAKDMDDAEVQAKAKAAAVWCEHATAVAAKPWSYLLIPHDAISDNKTMQGLAATYTVAVQGT